jgi:hypothetical protein
METEESPNTINVVSFPTFSRRGIALDFGTERRNSKPQKLGRKSDGLNDF